jgi:hypothetical protein
MFNDSLAHLLHYLPFKPFYQPSLQENPEWVYGELYGSDMLLDEHEHIQGPGNLPPDDLNCKRERVVAALMFSSDTTHLADFGEAKDWPLYMMLGNLSKYICSQPTSGTLHHVAYFPLVHLWLFSLVTG